MPFFLLIPSSIFGLYTLSTAVVPLVCPVALEPFGLTPSTSLYRVAMLAALLLPPVFLRQIALNSWKAARFSLPKRPAWKRMGTGFVLGAVIMSMLQWQFDIRRVDTHPEKWEALEITRVLLSGLVTGLAVGLVEESLFRGLVFTGMRRTLSFWPTALLTSALHAALHFMRPANLAIRRFRRRLPCKCSLSASLGWANPPNSPTVSSRCLLPAFF